MTEAPASREGFELALRSYLAQSREERTGRFSPDALAWLALPPPWTGRLAREAGFPGWNTTFLDDAEREGLCARTQPSLADRPSWYPTEVAARLAAHLPADSVAALLDGVAAIDDQPAQARILAVMTSALPPSLLPRAVQVANGLPDPAARTRALLGVAAVEPPAEAAATARLALGVAEQLDDPGDRAEALLLVAEQGRLDGEGEREFGRAILAALPGLAYESERGSVLARAARYLTPEQVGQALASAMALEAAECRIQALAGITERLPAERAVPLLRDEIPAIATIRTEIQRGRAARTLARRLADYGAADLASSAALTLSNEGARQSALQSVAGSLASAGDQDQAAQIAAELVSDGADGPDRVASLSALAQRLASGDRSIAAEVAERARQAASALTAAPRNARALVSLATALVQLGLKLGSVGERALRSAAEISRPEDRYQLCRTLAGTLLEPLRTRAAEQALAAARRIDSPAGRVEALADLVPHLPAEQREKTVRETLALAATEIDFSFWMPEPTRTNVLDELTLRHGPTFLHQHTVRIAESVREATRPDDPAPSAMARWAELADQGASSPAQAAAWLDRRLDELTDNGDSGQALAWVETGKLLVPVLGHELDSVVSVGMRRIELLYRRSLDQGHLRRFLPRQEQIDEFWRLIDGDDGAWAVHFLGAGGLGKTMLLRQVTARLAPERGMPTARVDFDHLSPDYPIARPGQLLLELLDELQSFATSSNAEGFAYSFRAQVAQLHVPVAQGSNDPLARIHDPQFDEVLRTFRDFVLLLPQPVVLILDTCEELAKRRSEGSTLPPVDATFEILERLHEEIPALRVIFAGRRLLARSGHDWTVEGFNPAADAEGHSLLPASKDYLRLHEMRGFGADEAVSYLTTAAPQLSEEMRAAILSRSLAPANAAPVVWQGSRPASSQVRYNPFDLNLYASWAREDRSLSADTIAQGTTDPYIAIRIVRRLGRTELDRLLPAVALLGRFDRSMLRGELSGGEEKFERAYYELSSQEWIDYQPDPSLNTTFLEVDRNLRPRLLSYYRSDPNRSVLLREARDRLGPALARLVEDRPLNQIGIDLADAAMRLLPEADAARLWDKVTGKIAAQCDWPWADQRTSRLLGEDGAVADPGHPARAAVVAARISSLIHTRPEYNPAPDWREVAERADASPDPAVRTWLHSRAIAGLVAAFRLPGVELSADDLAAFWELVDRFPDVTRQLPGQLAEQLAASCCAALEALVEVAEMRGDSSLVSDVGPVERWLDHVAGLVPPDLLALGTMITARVQALHGRFQAALNLAFRAETASAAMPAGRPARWADFDAPSVTCHRIRLELMRMAAAFPVPDDPLEAAPLKDWQRSAEADLGTIDADRLLATILQRHLSATIVPGDEVLRLSELEERAFKRARQSPRSALWCHVAVPPLFTALAWCWHALGRGDRAFELLNARRRRALATGDTSAENAALIATLEISRRMRIEQPVLAKNSSHADDANQRAAAWALAALTERPQGQAAVPVRTLCDAQLHDWWRTRPVLPAADSEDAEEFRRRAEQLTGHRGDLSPFAAACLGLDLTEAEIAEARSPVWRPVDLAGLATSGMVTAEQLARVRLRSHALSRPFPPAVVDDAWQSVGRRRRAELAMDEGELLALRLPREATVLLNLAATGFREAGDPAGALFATIAGTLARRRAGMPVGEDAVQAMAEAYQAVARQVEPPLPDFDTTERLTQSSPELDRAMGGWPERRRVATGWRPVVGIVPVELDPSVLTRRRRRRRARPSGDRLRIGSLTGLLTGFAATLTAVAATVTYTGNRLASASGIADAAGIAAVLGALATALVSLEALGVRRRLTDRARAWWWARAAVGLGIAPGSGAAAPGEVEVVIKRWQINPSFTDLWQTSHQWTEVVTLPPLRSYERGAAAIPTDLRKGLRKLAGRVGSRSVLVPLDIDPALDRLPWEALLSHPVLTGETPVPGALDFWRWGDPPPVTGPRPADGPPRPPDWVAVLADNTRRLFAERAELGRNLSFPDLSAGDGGDVNRAIERAGSRVTGQPDTVLDIVLVIGRPVRVRGAVLLQTAEQAAVKGTSADDLREAVIGGGLLEPEVVAGLRARLFIVLGAPTQQHGRFDTERRDAADLRGWAADVFRAGAATVIVLPSLDPELAGIVLKDIAGHIAEGITTRAVHGAVRAARTRIGTWIAPGPAAGDSERRVEQALDVCLFRRGRVAAARIREERG